MTGTIPPELLGKTLIRTGPNPRFKPLDMKYYHWFDGDGMLNAFYFEAGGVRYKNKWVETKKWTLENEAGSALYGGLRTPSSTTLEGWMKLRFGLLNLLWLGIRKLLGLGPTRSQFESIATILNCANTSVVRQGDKLMALDEAGKPYLLDRELGTLGLYDYGGKLVGPAIAHPHSDPFTGESFTMGYNALPPFFQYYRIGAGGAIEQYEPIDVPYGVMTLSVCRSTMSSSFICPRSSISGTSEPGSRFAGCRNGAPASESCRGTARHPIPGGSRSRPAGYSTT